MDKRIEFLYSALSDAQELIKFIDTKTAILITIIGAYIATLFSIIDKIVLYSKGYSIQFWLLVSLLVVLITLCIIVAARIVKPTTNPTNNVNMDGLSVPNLKFFLPQNEYKNEYLFPFINNKKDKLKLSLKLYTEQLKNIEDKDILYSLTYELFKVSYIRNIKSDRMKILIWLILITSIVFFTTYFFYVIETKNTQEIIENQKGLLPTCVWQKWGFCTFLIS